MMMLWTIASLLAFVCWAYPIYAVGAGAELEPGKRERVRQLAIAMMIYLGIYLLVTGILFVAR